MIEYPKIHTVWKRNERGKIIVEDYAIPEFAYLADNDWMATEKIDGTNIRVIWHGPLHDPSPRQAQILPYGVEFGGKTDNAQIPATLVARLRALFDSPEMREKLEAVFPDYQCGVCLYGEGFGKGIQKAGALYAPALADVGGVDFILFDVKVGNWWLQWDDVLDVAKKLGLRTPLVQDGTTGLDEWCSIVRYDAISDFGNFVGEGFVLRPTTDLFTRKGERILAKIKVKDYQ